MSEVRETQKRGRPHDNPKTDASVRNLIRLRRREGLKLRELASAFNISTGYVQKICSEPEEREGETTLASQGKTE